MRCEYCELAIDCTDTARFGGGCDLDGSDDFGCGFGYLDVDEENFNDEMEDYR